MLAERFSHGGDIPAKYIEQIVAQNSSLPNSRSASGGLYDHRLYSLPYRWMIRRTTRMRPSWLTCNYLEL